MSPHIGLPLLVVLSLTVTTCQHFDKDRPPYNFNHPDHEFRLPKSLDEISGLTALDWQYAAGVNDESGKFFVIDMTKGTVVNSKKVAKNTDLEDIVRVGARLYILDGKGRIYDIADMRASKLDVSIYELPGIDNPEGLEYDESNDRLLVGALHGPDPAGKKVAAIFSFDLSSKTVAPEPLWTLTMAQIRKALGKDSTTTAGLDRPLFKPSALAIQPSTGDVYLLSSKIHVVVVLDKSGQIKAVYPLPEDVFYEPEGISFLPNGTLYISNEENQQRPASLIGLKHRFVPF